MLHWLHDMPVTFDKTATEKWLRGTSVSLFLETNHKETNVRKGQRLEF